ncbi:unnamed protein product [Rotaria socialis]|uniref:Uncharacterized protein n=1 Tax=Rotaria socialis TaxID=392032 RepID=A0A821SAV4_9BILA|nr:unnamed protein product [Rotaria socialis]CAF4853834.1 unnamed protein product [Rotaria socialis]
MPIRVNDQDDPFRFAVVVSVAVFVQSVGVIVETRYCVSVFVVVVSIIVEEEEVVVSMFVVAGVVVEEEDVDSVCVDDSVAAGEVDVGYGFTEDDVALFVNIKTPDSSKAAAATVLTLCFNKSEALYLAVIVSMLSVTLLALSALDNTALQELALGLESLHRVNTAIDGFKS